MGSSYSDYPWELYDLDYEGFEDDVLLYRSLLGDRPSSVLELASGTGRILIPLARDGHESWGLELVDGMLQVTRAKVASEGPAVRSRIHLVTADMREFDLGRTFGAVILPLKTCLYLPRDDDYRRTIAQVRRHLRPGGLFLMDAFRPDDEVLDRFDGSWVLHYERVRPGTGERVKRSQRFVHDRLRRRLLSRHRWQITSRDGESRVRSLDLIQHYVGPEALRGFLEDAGFRVESTWGSYARGPADGPVEIDPHYPSWAQSTAFFVCRAP